MYLYMKYILHSTALLIFSRSCNQTHTFENGKEFYDKVKIALPQLFTSTVMCAGIHILKHMSHTRQPSCFAGDDFNGFGSCEGDSGGALTRFNSGKDRFEQIGIVQGGVGSCGDRKMPGIYIRLKDQDILSFIQSTIGSKT